MKSISVPLSCYFCIRDLKLQQAFLDPAKCSTSTVLAALPAMSLNAWEHLQVTACPEQISTAFNCLCSKAAN